MKQAGLYFKYNLKWIMGILLCGGTMAAVLVLNDAPTWEIVYGMLLCFVFLLVILAADGTATYRRCKKLREMEQNISISADARMEPQNPTEAEYLKLLRCLCEEMSRAENEWECREREQTEYYTMWVHQIKTPIAALKLLLQERNEQGEVKEELQELFSIEQYVKMALWYTRLDAESTDFVLQKISLDQVIRQAVRRYAGQFVYKKLTLDYKGLEVFLLSDEKWLEFVVEQLLSNAIKYTKKGSISIYMEKEKLVIEDTGIGIRKEDLPRVTEMGYTGYNGHADTHATGIGLYLCQRILTKLGDTLELDSTAGSGTKVSIGFPAGSVDCRD
jgi:hypothetical protein